MKDGTTREKRVYHATRPTVERVDVARLLQHVDRAGGIIAECDPAELCNFVLQVVDLGCLVGFTCTSDRGAVTISVCDGPNRHKAYARTADELLLCYRDLLASIRGEL